MIKKGHYPVCHWNKTYDAVILFKPASIKPYKGRHQFSCTIQVLFVNNLALTPDHRVIPLDRDADITPQFKVMNFFPLLV